jgi:hypothetical protein
VIGVRSEKLAEYRELHRIVPETGTEAAAAQPDVQHGAGVLME